MPDDSLKIKAYIEHSRELENEDIARSFELLDEAFSLTNTIGQPYWSSAVSKEKGILHYYARENEPALVELRKARLHCPSDAVLLKARIQNMFGNVHLQAEQIDSALVYFGQSMESYEQLDGYEGVITLLQNIGICHYQLGRPEVALDKMEQSYQWIVKSGDLEHLETVTLNIMQVLIESGRVDEAEDYFDRLLASGPMEKSPLTRVQLNEILGLYHQSTSEFTEAIGYFEKASELNDRFGLDEQEQIDLALAEVYGLTDRHEEANALLMALKPRLPTFKKLRYRALAENHEHLAQPDSSTKYWKAYVNTLIAERESLDLVESSSTDHDLEIFSKDMEIKDLEHEKKILALKSSRRRWMVAALFLLSFGLLTAIVWLRHRKRRELEQRAAELKEKQQKLMTLSLQMSQKNALLTSVADSVNGTTGTISEKGNEAMKELEMKFREAARMEEDWKLFSRYFEDLHNGFYDRLKVRAEELTTHDLRMCSLLRLRLSTKEIMDILFLSQDAVKSSRSRIRKKLGLATADNLTEFLQKA